MSTPNQEKIVISAPDTNNTNQTEANKKSSNTDDANINTMPTLHSSESVGLMASFRDTDTPLSNGKPRVMFADGSGLDIDTDITDNNNNNYNTQSLKDYYAQKNKLENEITDKHVNFGFDQADKELRNKLQLIETSSNTTLEKARRKLQVLYFVFCICGCFISLIL